MLISPALLLRHGPVPGRCTGFIDCWSSQGFPDEMGSISWSENVVWWCLLCAGKTPAVETCSPLCGAETCSGGLSWAELQHLAFPQSIF